MPSRDDSPTPSRYGIWPEGLPSLDSHSVILTRHARSLDAMRARLDSSEERLEKADVWRERLDVEMTGQTRKLDQILLALKVAGAVITPALAAACAALVSYIVRAH